MSEIIENNSEILFIYDAKMCNPNGDPDDENKPRIDYERNLNIVSDVRLKRYIRDYISDFEDSDNNKIFVRKIDGAPVNAKKSLSIILGIEDKQKIHLTKEQAESFIQKAIDVRMFGGIIPDVKFSNKSNATYTGPIQFNWGCSLNKVSGTFDSSGITSHFQTGKSDEDTEGGKSSGAMGKMYKVAYSVIAFHGIISAKRAEETKLSASDIGLFDRAIVRCIPLEATTESKAGQEPLFYMRVEYNSDNYFIGDFRKYLKLSDKNDKEITFDNSSKLDRGQYKIDVTDLIEKLEKKKDHISKIHFWKNEDIELKGIKIEKAENNSQKKFIKLNDTDKIELDEIDIEKKYTMEQQDEQQSS
jgi:CRISPR-associated protein Csh2